MIDVSGLEAAVNAQSPGVDSLVAFVTELKAQLAAELANDPASQMIINAAMDKVLANNAKLAAAMDATPTP